MKILFSNKIFFEQKYGGISRYFFSIFNELIKKKIDFKIVSPIYKNNYIKTLDDRFKVGLHFAKYPSLKFINFINEKLSLSLIKDSNCDIIHDTYYSSYLNEIRNKKKIITVHDLIHEKFSQYYESAKIIEEKKNYFKNINHFVCVSISTKYDLQEIYNIPDDKISVIYHGSNHLDNYKKTNPLINFKKFILYVGNRHRYKNFKSLLDVYSKNKNINANFDLVCFGGEKVDKNEIEILNKYKIKNKVKFIRSEVNDLNLKSLYQSASVMISTSLYEGFGINILEALSQGCAVILRKLKVFKEIYNDLPIYYEDESELDYVLSNYLMNTLKVRSKKKEFIEFSKKFNWSSSADNLIDIYRNL